MTEEITSDVYLNETTKARKVKYDVRIHQADNKVLSMRRSKKGGSTYSNFLLDLIYMIGKVDPYFWDMLVRDRYFPEMIKQMQEAYARKSLEPGWSPEQVEQLQAYANKRVSEEKK